MNDKVDSSRFSKVQVDDEESADEKLQTKLTRFVSKSKSNLSVLSSKTYTKLEPIILVLKNNIVRYSISAILFVLVIFLYILYELPSVIEDIVLRASLVPIGLILATIAILYVTWDDQYLKKFRTPGIYVVILTTIRDQYHAADSFFQGCSHCFPNGNRRQVAPTDRIVASVDVFRLGVRNPTPGTLGVRAEGVTHEPLSGRTARSVIKSRY